MSVEQAIDCFSQILSFNGFSNVPMEVFHQAKFDRNEATRPLWRLIFEMIYSDREEFLNGKFDQLPQSVIVNGIKREMYKRGYTYEQFVSLDTNMEKGSRQLLICLGWLISQTKLIEKCMKQYVDSISNLDQSDEYANCDVMKQIKEILQSNMKIRARLEDIEHINLHENSHMSAFEQQLCQYPHLISQYLTELDHECQTLNLFLYWDKYENTFWKWMEGVLDQPTVLASDHQQLEMEKQKFNEAVDTLDSVLIRLEELWLSHDDRASIEEDIASIITSIDLQISSLFHQLLNSNQSSIINFE